MILFKTTQDKVLAVLQSVCGIVERRHTMPILSRWSGTPARTRCWPGCS